jgi:hypothetical protein
VILTRYVFGSVREASTSAGCDRFLLKPCLPGVLSREIDSLMIRMAREQRHMVRARKSQPVQGQQDVVVAFRPAAAVASSNTRESRTVQEAVSDMAAARYASTRAHRTHDVSFGFNASAPPLQGI